MYIKVYQTTNVVWESSCNSHIDGEGAASFDGVAFVLKTDILPCVNERLCIDNDTYFVKSVERILTNLHQTEDCCIYAEEEIKIRVQPKNIYVDYYDYMKKFTHACDHMKMDNDPTKDLTKVNDEIIWPETLKEWEEKIKELEEEK